MVLQKFLKIPQFCSKKKENGDLSDDDAISEESNVRKKHPLVGLLIIIITLTVFGLLFLDYSASTPLYIPDEREYPDSFIGERAQNFLRRLTDLGPRVTGSEANEVDAVNLLTSEIEKILKSKHANQRIQFEVQKSSGLYNYDPLEPYVYADIQGVVVKFAGYKSPHHAIVVNAHFDSVPTSPGGMDNGFMCSIMMEIINKMARSEQRYDHDVIFLFNGGEEPGLLGAHAFVTQHKWAKNAKLFINLDSAGVGEREMLYQSSSDRPWLLKYYQNVPLPQAQVMGQEVFEQKLIPSDTDYRVFTETGEMYGYDFAIANNGYRHHSRLDGFSHITLRSYQHVGDNIYALIQGVANALEISEDVREEENMTYYDIMGWFVIAHTEGFTIAINVIVILLSVGAAFASFCRLGLLKFSMENCKYLGLTFGGILLGWFVAFGLTYLLALLFDGIDYTMTWYNNSWLLGIYFFPALACISGSLFLINMFAKKILSDDFNVQKQAIVQCHVTILYWTLVLIVMMIMGIRSRYLIVTPIWSSNIALVFILCFMPLKGKSWLLVYLLTVTIPMIFTFNVAKIIFTIFVPTVGRNGSGSNPEVLIGLVTVFLTLLSATYLVPIIITLSKKPHYIILVLLAAFLLFLIFIFTPLGFPYSESIRSPAPQRFTIYHASRKMHNFNGDVVYFDSGFYSINHDRNSPKSVSNYIPEFESPQPIDLTCKTILYCGLPIVESRSLESLMSGTWISADPPTVSNPPTLVLEEKIVTASSYRFNFKVTGPSRIGISFSPRANLKLLGSSLLLEVPSEVIQWEGRDVYFVNFVRGMGDDSLSFFIDVEVPTQNVDEPVLTIGMTAKYLHDVEINPTFGNLLRRFPDWTVVAPHVSIFESWMF